MGFNSDARQDEFVANMLSFKRDGSYVDIGSCGAVGANNSCFFESLGWKGICVEIEPGYKPTYANRTCCLINQDALQVDYKKVFEENKMPKSIDYLSVDIDTLSIDALMKLPFDEYEFKVITIEHDYYLYGEEYKGRQKELLQNLGYEVLCENVMVEQPGYGPNLPFEDWWVKPEFFARELLDKIKCDFEYPSKIIGNF